MMSFLSEGSPEAIGDEKRAKKLAAARKKLKSYRASRSSITSSASSRSGSGSPTKLSISKPVPRHPSGSSIPPLPKSRQGSVSSPGHSRTPSGAPLGDSTAGNVAAPRRPSGSVKGKERAVEASPKASVSTSHRRTDSRSRHERHGSLAARASVMGVFDLPPFPSGYGESSTSGGAREMPHEIITTPATPLPDSVDLDPLSATSYTSARESEGSNEEDVEATRSRLSSFSFGSKPPPDVPIRRVGRSASPIRHQQPLPPSMALRMHDAGFAMPPSPLGSPSTSHSAPSNLHRLSSTPSRPPSLLLTKASPLPTSPSGSPRADRTSPQTPPAVGRVKRHSHSRSSSISMPNLKLSGRPNSLGIPMSPSFPASPSSTGIASPLTSPSSERGRAPLTNGARLKFEPSGRGAEAEKEKEEYRRQALAKLTASSPAIQTPISPVEEIALPDLDDGDEVESSHSPSRPSSGSAWSWRQPDSVASAPFWASEDPGSGFGKDGWSGGSGFGFGMRDEGLGFGLDLGAVKRGSLTGGLSVLAEVEEVEELEEEGGDEEEPTPVVPFETPAFHAATAPVLPQPQIAHTPTSSTTPTPKGLRGFRLSSSASHTPIRADDSAASATPPSTSPTKGYGAIGRGRPRPLSNLANAAIVSSSTPTTASTVSTASLVTPTSAPTGRGRGRGSSISYKKDHHESTSTTTTTASAGASMSSRDWAFDRKVGSPFTSTSSVDVTSPTLGGMGSPTWSTAPLRGSANRPCPRPKSMANQGIDAGANRVLGNVEEEEGDWPTVSSRASNIHAGLALDDVDDFGFGGARGHTAVDSIVFRDRLLEVEMERDALREDVEGWRGRCRGLEESLEGEKKESGALRERIRKLGDRLLTISSAQTPDPTSLDERAMSQMRDQFFQLTASLERERREKEEAHRRIEVMQAFMLAHGLQLPQFSPPSPSASGAVGGWSFPKASAPKAISPRPVPLAIAPTPKCGDPFLSSNPPLISPREGRDPQDPNAHRMKAWGFPSPGEAPLPSPKLTSKRDSFFGLSAVLRKRDSVPTATGDECLGIDLPPISFPSTPSTFFPPSTTQRAVSDPYRHASTTSPPSADPHRSVSLPLSAGSSTSTGAFSFISGYWRSKSSGPASQASNGSPTSASVSGSRGSEASWKRSPPRPDVAALERIAMACTPGATDLRSACKCCSGPLIEL